MNLSYEFNKSINLSKGKRYPNFNEKKNKLSKSFGKTPHSIYIRKKYFKDTDKSEDSSEEDYKARLIQQREEFRESLVKLLTESPEDIKKKKSKLKPLCLNTKSNFDKTLSSKSRILTESSKTITIPKIMSLKEKKKLLLEIKREKERKERERERKENLKILKEIKLKQSQNKEIFRSNLNRLYGYNRKFLFYNAKLKKDKCSNLEKYHENILRVSSINISKDNLLKLFSDLKTIKINSESSKPLPPINFRALVHHSLDEGTKKKRFGYKEPIKKFWEMDEYEKEMFKIKTNTRHEKINFNNNKFLYKMYEILPEHVVESVYAKKRKF